MPQTARGVASDPEAPGTFKFAAYQESDSSPLPCMCLQENHALYQRLVALKPSKDISRDFLQQEQRAHEKYRSNCSTYKKGGGTPNNSCPGASSSSPGDLAGRSSSPGVLAGRH
jgi:hypothetical protein